MSVMLISNQNLKHELEVFLDTIQENIERNV